MTTATMTAKTTSLLPPLPIPRRTIRQQCKTTQAKCTVAIHSRRLPGSSRRSKHRSRRLSADTSREGKRIGSSCSGYRAYIRSTLRSSISYKDLSFHTLTTFNLFEPLLLNPAFKYRTFNQPKSRAQELLLHSLLPIHGTLLSHQSTILVVAIDLLLQIRNDRALLHVTVALGCAVDHLPQRAETGRACQRCGLGAERHGSCGAGREELRRMVSDGCDEHNSQDEWNLQMRQPKAKRAKKPGPHPRGYRHPRPFAWSRKRYTRCKWQP